MKDSVALLRSRWTPELTDAATQFLQGNPTGADIPTMELDGQTYLDLRGIRIEQTQLDGITFLTFGHGELMRIEGIPRLLIVLEGIMGLTFIGMLIASATKKIMNR